MTRPGQGVANDVSRARYILPELANRPNRTRVLSRTAAATATATATGGAATLGTARAAAARRAGGDCLWGTLRTTGRSGRVLGR